jgi:hypothetical protein
MTKEDKKEKLDLQTALLYVNIGEIILKEVEEQVEKNKKEEKKLLKQKWNK